MIKVEVNTEIGKKVNNSMVAGVMTAGNELLTQELCALFEAVKKVKSEVLYAAIAMFLAEGEDEE